MYLKRIRNCSKCGEEYFAKGLCKTHYLEKWNKENPKYNKNYCKKYWKEKKKDPEFMKRRKIYMNSYNGMISLQTKLAHLTIVPHSDPITDLFGL